MELRILRYFLAVVREESITKAAEILHITQPTLSRQLSALEEELGVTLFIRGARKVTLTEEGLLLRRRAEEILGLVDKTTEEIQVQDGELQGKIVLGAGELASMQQVADWIGAFQLRHPGVQVELFTGTADQVKDRMDHGLVDLGLLLEPVDIEKYDFIRLGVRERFAMLVRADDPLAREASVTKEDLMDRRLILPSRMNVQNELASWFGSDFQKVNISYLTNFINNAAFFVEKGMANSITVEGAAPFLDPKRLVFLPLSPELTAGSVLAWRRNQPFGKATEQLIREITGQKR